MTIYIKDIYPPGLDIADGTPLTDVQTDVGTYVIKVGDVLVLDDADGNWKRFAHLAEIFGGYGTVTSVDDGEIDLTRHPIVRWPTIGQRRSDPIHNPQPVPTAEGRTGRGLLFATSPYYLATFAGGSEYWVAYDSDTGDWQKLRLFFPVFLRPTGASGAWRERGGILPLATHHAAPDIGNDFYILWHDWNPAIIDGSLQGSPNYAAPMHTTAMLTNGTIGHIASADAVWRDMHQAHSYSQLANQTIDGEGIPWTASHVLANSVVNVETGVETETADLYASGSLPSSTLAGVGWWTPSVNTSIISDSVYQISLPTIAPPGGSISSVEVFWQVMIPHPDVLTGDADATGDPRVFDMVNDIEGETWLTWLDLGKGSYNTEANLPRLAQAYDVHVSIHVKDYDDPDTSGIPFHRVVAGAAIGRLTVTVPADPTA